MISRQLPTCLRVLALGLAIQRAYAQDAKCYYPNGSEAPSTEKPCSSADGSACCPDNWECLDNGLCHYAPGNLWGRYSCTDKDWQADGCPSNLCTYGGSASGGESITQCSDHNNNWCCNADAQHVDCCKESPSPRPFFVLQDGQPYATIGAMEASSAPNIKTVTGEALGTGSGGGGSSVSSTPSPSSNSPSSSGDKSASAEATPTGPTTPVTSAFTSVSSGTAGIKTIVVTSVLSPGVPANTNTNVPTTTNVPQKKSNLGVIVGCAVGIPLALALAGILLWLCRKRRNQKKLGEKNPYEDGYPNGTSEGANSPFAGGAAAKLQKPGATTYKSEEAGVPELAGQSVGPGRPVSAIKGRAELGSGSTFAPGTVPFAPNAVGLGGGTGHTPQHSWGSAPPGYSPGMNSQAFVAPAPHEGAAELPAEVENSRVEAPNTGVAPAAATEGGRYIPYRPPQGHAAATTTGGEGGAAELPTVKTPPA